MLSPISTLYMTKKAISTTHLTKNPKGLLAKFLARLPRKAIFSPTGPIDAKDRATWKWKTALNPEPNLGPEFHNQTKITICTPLVTSNPEVIDLTEEISNPVIYLTESGPTIKQPPYPEPYQATETQTLLRQN
jgi:hypothetical protein